MAAIKRWWCAERVNRFEKRTSQDYCPTNGGAVLYACFWFSYPALMYAFLTFGDK